MSLNLTAPTISAKGRELSAELAQSSTIAAMKIDLLAAQELTLRVGESVIKLSNGMIEIKGPLVKLNCD